MHTQALITFGADHARDTEEARQFALKFLVEDGFALGGRFCSGPADWFVVGGRSSGFLADTIDMPRVHGRDVYKREGYDDDAMVVTEDLYEKLLKEYEGKNEDDNGLFWDLDYDEVSREFIGKKWLVVLDYHS